MTIKTKLYGSFSIIIIVLAAAGIYIYNTVAKFDQISDEKAMRYEQIDEIKQLRLINTTITLIAMDSIVDKDSGEMEKERLDEINAQFNLVWEKEKKLMQLADTDEEKQLINKIIKAFKNLEPLIKNDLKGLIESRAGQEAFEKLDNNIDGAAGSMDNDIAMVVNSIQDELKEASELEANYAKSMKTSIIIAILIAILLGILFAGILSKGIISGLLKLNSAIKNLTTSNDTSSRVDLENKDELGEIAKNFNLYLSSIDKGIQEDKKLIKDAKNVIDRVKHGWYSEYIQGTTSNTALEEFKNEVNEMIKATKQHFININSVLEEYANYDYKKELTLDNIEKGGVFEVLATSINTLRDAITQMLVENKRDGITLDNSAQTLVSNVTVLSEASNQAAASLEETAAALEEITGNITNNTENVVQMAKYANDLQTSSKEGEKLANDTTSSMDEINEQVNAINEAITVIDQIAFQTNILSLNAAVEAATAGEAGKGFAVVAQEVRNLAARSAEAAKEIKDLVENATTKANEGKSIADKMIEGYHSVNDNISKTIDLIKNVESASKEQKIGIEQINSTVTEQDQQTQQNANVASQVQEIANTTSAIASKIVESADEKEFDGKHEIDKRANPIDPRYAGDEKRGIESRIKNLNQNTSFNVSSTATPKPKKEIKPETTKDAITNDEWESF